MGSSNRGAALLVDGRDQVGRVEARVDGLRAGDRKEIVRVEIVAGVNSKAHS